MSTAETWDLCLLRRGPVVTLCPHGLRWWTTDFSIPLERSWEKEQKEARLKTSPQPRDRQPVELAFESHWTHQVQSTLS